MKTLRPRIDDIPHCIVIARLPLVVTYPEHIDLSPFLLLDHYTELQPDPAQIQTYSQVPVSPSPNFTFGATGTAIALSQLRLVTAPMASKGVPLCVTRTLITTLLYIFPYPTMGTIAQSSLVPTHSVHQISSLSLIVSVSVQLWNIAGTILVAGHEVIPRYLCSSYAARISPHTSPSRKDTDSDSMDIP